MEESGAPVQAPPARDLVWHARRWFAAGAINFCILLLGLMVTLFVAGAESVELWIDKWWPLLSIATYPAALVVAYRKMR